MTIKPVHFLREFTDEVKSNIITEATDPTKKKYFIEGIMLQSNVRNKNGRVYPTEFVGKEIERYTTEMVQQKRAVGELGHPETPNVNYERAAHIIVDLKIDGNDVYGKARILGERFPLANIVKGLIDDDVRFGVSLRGTATTYKGGQGDVLVGEDFELAAIDIVHDPSMPKAFVSALMESRVTQWIRRGDGVYVPANADKLVEENKKEVNKIIRENKFDRAARLKKYETVVESFISGLKF